MSADRLQRQPDAAHQEISFRLLVEQVTDYAIFLLDPTGHIVTWNSGAARIKGYRADEIIGRHVSTFYPPEDIAAGKPGRGLSTAATVGRFEDEGIRVRKDGSRFWADVVITALRDHDGTLRGFAKVTRDVTERREAAEKLQRAHDDLDRRVIERTAELTVANDELRRVDRQKNEFLAMLAHELRNPLAPVCNALHILRAADADAAATEWARGMIDRQVRHLAGLIDSLMDASRLTRGLVCPIKERLDFAQVVRTAAEDRRQMFENAGISVRVGTRAESVWVNGDGTRLNQVFANLLDNAAKFTDRGGRVDVELTAADGHATLTVRDTGIGITADMVPRLFEVFAQADRTLDRSRGGLGLGLALVKGLVELHGGTVSASSAGAGAGATFTVRLPLAGPVT